MTDDLLTEREPDVSVVMPCHDVRRFDHILGAVAELSRQTVTPRDIILSVDHQPELSRLLRQAIPQVTVVENLSGNRGAGPNRNRGVEFVRTELVAFLDDDEVPDQSWLERLLRPFDDPRVVGTGGKCLPLWDGGRPKWYPPAFGWVIGVHDEGWPSDTAEVRNVWSGSMAVRVEAFRRVGGFRAGFGKIGDASQPEDTDLCIRVSQSSGKVWVFVPDAQMFHHVPTERSTFRFFLRRCFNEGRNKVLLRALNAEQIGPVLSSEAAYLRSTIPGTAQGEVSTIGRTFVRLGAMAAGLASAAVGGASGVIQPRRAA